MQDVFVIVANTRARQAIPVGRRTLAGRFSGGKNSCRVPLAEFLGPEIRSHISDNRLTVVRFSSDEARRAWDAGGFDALAAWAAGAPPEELTSVHTAAEEPGEPLAPSPEEPVTPPEEPPAPPEEPPAPPADPPARPEGPSTPVLWTEESLRALPWRGEGSLHQVAESLGVSGKTKDDLIAGILAAQEGA